MPAEISRWVFGYGSLMWNPGFPHRRTVAARLQGYHRKLCVYSFHYRGRPDKPGLVFGLDRGGSCLGQAFEVAEKDWMETYAYLQKREQITMVYKEVTTPVTLAETGERVTALTYIVDRAHPQCAARLSEDDMLRMVRQGEGEAGGCIDYVRNTHAHLQKLGLSDPGLSRIVARL